MSLQIHDSHHGSAEYLGTIPNKLTATAAFHNFRHFYIGWPTRPDTWRQNGALAQAAIVKFVEAILTNTTQVVVILVTSCKAHQASAADRFSTILTKPHKSRFRVTCVPSNDCWLQDIGPTFARSANGNLAGISFNFNAWGGANGGCYTDFALDQKFASQLLRMRQLREVKLDLTLEGGALSHDGRGTLLTTRECVLHANRNGGLSAPRLEAELRSALDVRKLIWLPRGAAHDTDTDGHVDNLAVFIAPATVLLLWADADVSPEQHARSRDALAVLHRARDADGNRLRIFRIDAPPPLRRTAAEAIADTAGAKERGAGEILCASYVNLVIIEDVVIAPKFGSPVADRRAFCQLSAAFNGCGKRVVQVDARELVLAGGGLHCISLGEPDGTTL